MVRSAVAAIQQQKPATAQASRGQKETKGVHTATPRQVRRDSWQPRILQPAVVKPTPTSREVHLTRGSAGTEETRQACSSERNLVCQAFDFASRTAAPRSSGAKRDRSNCGRARAVEAGVVCNSMLLRLPTTYCCVERSSPLTRHHAGPPIRQPDGCNSTFPVARERGKSERACRARGKGKAEKC